MEVRMNRVIILIIAVSFIVTGMAFANQDITKVKISDAMKIEKPVDLNQQSQAVPVQQIPLPQGAIAVSPGTVVGTTWYDYQTNGSTGNRVAKTTCGTHMSWMNAVGGYPGTRHIYYNFRNPAGVFTWPGVGMQVNTGVGAGYTTLDYGAGGVGMVAYHQVALGGVKLAVDASCGAGIFTIYDPADTVLGVGHLWPYIAYDNGGRVQLVATENATGGQKVGHTFSNNPAVWPPMQAFNNGDDVMDVSPMVTASSTNNKVALVWTRPRPNPPVDQYNNDVCYLESTNGTTWNYATYTNITNYLATDTIRAYTDVDAVYDKSGNLHIIWNTPFYDEVNGTVSVDACLLWHWSAATGIDMIANGWFASFPGAWNRSISKMSIGVDSCNNLFAVWTQFNATDVSAGGRSNGDLFMSYSSDGGTTWSTPANLTNSQTPGCLAGNCDSDHWSSLDEKVDDNLRILYINDKDAGGIPQTEGSGTENPVMYFEYPNPLCQPQGACCDVNMVPDTYPINVPPGGSFGLTGFIANPTSAPIATDVWVGVKYLTSFFQLWYFANIPLNPGQFLSAHMNQAVPGFAPLGTYTYIAYCGDRPTNVKCDSAFFSFSVVGGRIEGGYDAWTLEGGFDAGNTPNEYAAGSYPNPFNATTTITYVIPTAGNVNLAVYNIAGQKVATLVDGYNEAGPHSVTWDAANYSSGIYFYKLSAGEKVFTERMTLLK
ncbi:MAG: hypothetical protein CO189_00545 [candidate division Zixibacteria bacterium CG_4_9_14_3_um_filter_46_8]|nr:MAG: hypothetical protein CO189_00545 [candidate division Zixibacteria bacterium CG_4_9_14_3_um_filter_46_8]